MATSFDSVLSGLGIKRYGSGGTTDTTKTGSGKGLEQMGAADFVALMIAQMKNQDPFEPVDNTQMVAQMAQFSSLSATTEMSTTLKAIAEKLDAGASGNALSYVGRTVLTAGATAYPRASGGFAGAVELGGDASAVTVTITNAQGQVVKSVDLGQHKAGIVNFDWDGSTDGGTAAGDGPFTVAAHAKNGTATIKSQTLVWAPVTSVSMPSGGAPVLSVVGVGQISPDAVRSIA